MASANVTVSRNWSLADVELITAEDMREIGLLQREHILRRTLAGSDVSGQTFQPYSAAYAAEKGSAFVNLQVSGNMLNHLVVTEVTSGDGKATVTLGWLQ